MCGKTCAISCVWRSEINFVFSHSAFMRTLGMEFRPSALCGSCFTHWPTLVGPIVFICICLWWWWWEHRWRADPHWLGSVLAFHCVGHRGLNSGPPQTISQTRYLLHGTLRFWFTEFILSLGTIRQARSQSTCLMMPALSSQNEPHSERLLPLYPPTQQGSLDMAPSHSFRGIPTPPLLLLDWLLSLAFLCILIHSPTLCSCTPTVWGQHSSIRQVLQHRLETLRLLLLPIVSLWLCY